MIKISEVLQNRDANIIENIVRMKVLSPWKKPSLAEVSIESQLDPESTDTPLPCQWDILEMQSMSAPCLVLSHIFMYNCLHNLQQHEHKSHQSPF